MILKTKHWLECLFFFFFIYFISSVYKTLFIFMFKIIHFISTISWEVIIINMTSQASFDKINTESSNDLFQESVSNSIYETIESHDESNLNFLLYWIFNSLNKINFSSWIKWKWRKNQHATKNISKFPGWVKVGMGGGGKVTGWSVGVRAGGVERRRPGDNLTSVRTA